MLNKILSLCEQHGFIRRMCFPALKIDHYRIGPIGMLLRKNVENEWYNNVVINKDYTVFLSAGNFLNAFEFAKKMCSEMLPFGIAEIKNKDKYHLQLNCEDFVENYKKRVEELENGKSGNFDLKELLVDESKSSLKCAMFVPNIEGVQFFHQWQRQRRIWWRKFSPNPGRYHLSDIRICESDHTQNVDIFLEYPWGNQHLESLTLYQRDLDFYGKPEEQFKDGKRNVVTNTIVSTIDLNTLFLNTIFDAYDNSVYKNIRRTLLRFHRKIAPYKISVTIAAATVTPELKELALYLTRQLRTTQISTLLLPSSTKSLREVQLKQNDELGIPYNILLNENTLKNGILLLRSRDTTLKEQVHVSELVGYVEQLFKNY